MAKDNEKRLAQLTLAIEVKIKLHHIENPVLSQSLEQEFSISGVQVREVVRMLRRAGVPVANTGGATEGYFIARTYGEIEPTIEDLKARETSLRMTRMALMKKFNMSEGLFA